MQKKVDFLVLGSGLAGLSYALKVADLGSVCIVTKTDLKESNTRYAQGGIAAVTYKSDSYEKHINDTLIAGGNISKRDVVEMVVSNAPARIQELIDFGTNFDKKTNGEYDLAKEGGHSENRILHYKDVTGQEIIRSLIEQVKKHPNISIKEHFFAVDLITQHHLGEIITRSTPDTECYGAYVMDMKNHKIETVISKITYIATGGIGNIYNVTTNPNIATGDGIAMAYRAKAVIENMEFVQFHPTSLYNPSERPSFLITEAMRGFGAIIKNQKGEKFMNKYDERGSLAPRDIVARSIDTEMKISGDDFVYLDATKLNFTELVNHFPNIYKKCLELDIDIIENPMPIVPAAHYLCGGIKVDKKGKTTIKNLYSGGESSYTGLHGANRLASNSLLEAVVYAHNSAMAAKEIINDIEFNTEIADWDDSGTTLPEEMILITQEYKELEQIMTNYVGIVRSNIRLQRALKRLEIINNETEELYNKSKLSPKICELRNAINVAYLIIKMAKRRNKSVGLHFNVDLPVQK